ncbi:MAG: spore maturation protein [Clostridia bacterium]|nr:spore maturation protein [Clostridia bacterium]
MSAYILPVLIIMVLIFAFIRRVAVFDSFAEGAKEALKLIGSIFPYIAGIFVCVTLFRVSGLAAAVTKLVTPFSNTIGIPPELTELIVIRPMSGSGSLALIENIYETYGADSYIARCASVIMGSSETIFYVAAIYFSTTNVKKLRFAIPIALFASVAGAIISCLLCRFL